MTIGDHDLLSHWEAAFTHFMKRFSTSFARREPREWAQTLVDVVVGIVPERAGAS